ncbi:DUF2341 domain-containing protein [Candidatus Bathyarchaeota archaeon]|nr:DUF2341 domain-containing protein [Candidatus Bathyarchaeota archaeon]
MTGKRRAVGSLISVMFLILILTSGYGYYQTRQTVQTRRQRILDEMKEFDHNKALEDLEINKSDLSGSNQLNLKLENTGEILLTVSYIGVFNESVSPREQQYIDVAFSLNPVDEIWYNSSITINPSQDYTIQLLTERGNIFYTSYPYIEPLPSGNGTDTQIDITSIGLLEQTYPSDYRINNGTYANGSLPDSVTDIDGDFFTVDSELQTTDLIYVPSAYTISSGELASGTVSDVQQDDQNTLQVRSSPSDFPSQWNQWSYRKKITINNTYIDEDLSDFPVFINITDPDLANNAQNDFDDILFIDQNNSTQLDHEIEDYDGTTGYLAAWVNTDLSTAQDTVIWMYYGNPSSPNQEKPSQVWANDFNGVWHMSQNPGADPQLLDSTSNNEDGSFQGGMDSSDQVNGKANGALDFDGVNDYINLGDIDTRLDAVTVEAWFYHESTGDERIFCKSRGTAVSDHILSLGIDDDIVRVRVDTQGPGGGVTSHDSNPFATTNKWQYVAFTWSRTTENLYIYGDDTVIGSFNKQGFRIQDPNIDVTIGNVNTVDSRYWDGVLDEIRLSSVDRDPAWLKATYFTTSEPDKFVSLGPQQGQDTSVSVVFTGNSNTLSLNALNFTTHIAYNTSSVPTIIQLYDYNAGQYPTSGDGYISYTSSATAETEEIKFQYITTNPDNYRAPNGNWKIRVTGDLSGSNLLAYYDYISYKTKTNAVNIASTNYTFTGINSSNPTSLKLKLVSSNTKSGVNSLAQLYDYNSQQYAASGEAYTTWSSTSGNDTIWLNITSNPEYYVDNGIASLRFVSTYDASFSQDTDQLYLNYTYASTELPYDTYKSCLISVTKISTSEPLPYIGLILYADGSNVDFLGQSNPVYTNTDVNGQYRITLKSSTLGGEAFTLYAYVGSLVESKELVQLP